MSLAKGEQFTRSICDALTAGDIKRLKDIQLGYTYLTPTNVRDIKDIVLLLLGIVNKKGTMLRLLEEQRDFLAAEQIRLEAFIEEISIYPPTSPLEAGGYDATISDVEEQDGKVVVSMEIDVDSHHPISLDEELEREG